MLTNTLFCLKGFIIRGFIFFFLFVNAVNTDKESEYMKCFVFVCSYEAKGQIFGHHFAPNIELLL